MAFSNKSPWTLTLVVALSALHNNVNILAANLECSSQLQCEQDSGITCIGSEVACCSDLQTAGDIKGTVFVLRKGSCVCCEKCEILQEAPQPLPISMGQGPGENRQVKSIMWLFSRTRATGLSRRRDIIKARNILGGA